jgi:hypothetical protein
VAWFFELIPPSGNGEWQERVLYAFHGGADGGQPVGNLVFDSSGNLYGATSLGGLTSNTCAQGCGTVFELSPNQNGDWNETVLYEFQNGSDGYYPSDVVFDSSGNLFGVSKFGRYRYGSAIFELSPPQQKGGAWTETTVYGREFPPLSSTNLVFGRNGRLYDTSIPGISYGGVFDLKDVGQNWKKTNLYRFKGGGNGGDPMSGVILDNHGRMYGTTISGGNNWGIAFELKRSGGKWKQVMLHNFCSQNYCADGASPYAPLTLDRRGNLYGMTVAGGKGVGNGCDAHHSVGCGVVFKLSTTKSGSWKEIVLHNFQGGPVGQGSANGLILDDKGHIYGTTADGGDSFGSVFEITP